MQEYLDLHDARGYRSKYINRLNDAVKETRIIGGDVEPIVTEAGTLLKVNPEGAQTRFKLFAGVATVNGELYNVRAVGDGCFFAGGEFIKLKNAVNTFYKKGGLMPRTSGWHSGLAPASSWGKCDVIIFTFNNEYYIGFRYDGMELYRLIDGATQADEQNIKIIATIGTFNNTLQEIIQYIATDIYYGGNIEETPLEPWQIFSTVEPVEGTDQTETVWWVAQPQWYLDAPFAEKPEDVVTPVPQKTLDFESYYSEYEYREFRNVKCWKLDDIMQGSCAGSGRGILYAVLDTDGAPTIYSFNSRINDTPACILLGYFTEKEITTENEEGEEITETVEIWTQERTGVFRSFWRETPAYYVRENEDGTVIRYPNAPVNQPEGTVMLQYSFWMLETHINGDLYKIAEQLNNSRETPLYPYPQYAALYGNWIWRYNLHYRASDNTLIKDELTTPVTNVTASMFARIIDQPYVDRIEVVYPETPLDQGQVNEVHSNIKVLAVEINETQRTTLFKTETISATEGGIIEVTQ